MTKFETGKPSTMRSVCDYNCTWSYKVIARTEKTITIEDEYGKVKKCKVSKWSTTEEVIYPLGVYSMCPALRAA